MIAGSSKKVRKTYLRMVQSFQITKHLPKLTRVDNPTINFTKEDARRLHHPYDNALVINLSIADFNTRRVLVNNGSSDNILYYPTFQQMRIGKKWLYHWTHTSWDLVVPKSSPSGPLPTSNHRHLPSPAYQGDHLPGFRLFFSLQCHHQATYTQHMESSHLYLPLASKIPDGVWGKKGTQRLNGGSQVPHNHVGNG